MTNDKIIYTVDRLTRRIDVGDQQMIREWIDMACSLMPKQSTDDIPLRMTEPHVPC
ncbi:hypothetical protein [Variovorax sp. PBL-E5]|uniref:hypothetical protein n=1 Tax=Variovorax sp. PBL-E5 TaxID=434014 RepID=UPI0013A55A9E|nr:hypothetical protein [Variovorax sp. PBL-E5]